MVLGGASAMALARGGASGMVGVAYTPLTGGVLVTAAGMATGVASVIEGVASVGDCRRILVNISGFKAPYSRDTIV